VAEAVRGGSRVRRAQGGWGRAPPVQGWVWQWREEQLVAAAAHDAIQRVEEMRGREGEAEERKGGAGYTRLCSSGRHISRRT
jgi:hypothetical protein